MGDSCPSGVGHETFSDSYFALFNLCGGYEMACCIACQQHINTEDDYDFTSFSGVEHGVAYVAFIHLSCLSEAQEPPTQQVRSINHGSACTLPTIIGVPSLRAVSA